MIENKMKGTLLGLAYGDILGCPIETYRDTEIKNLYGGYLDLPKEYPLAKITNEKRRKKLRPIGLYSDDTQQAMALINLIINKGFTASAWGQLLVKGNKANAWRDYGRNFIEAIQKLSKGVAFHSAGSASAGIGSAMRIAPLAALYMEDPEKLKEVVYTSTFITHADARAASIAYAVAWVTQQYLLDKDDTYIIENIGKSVLEAEEWAKVKYKGWKLVDLTGANQVSDGITELFGGNYRTEKDLRNKISKIAAPLLQEGFTKAHVNQGFCLLGGLHAISMAVLFGDNPKETLLSIVREGYDTDTVAAVAGGILGAKHGIEWIPMNQIYEPERLIHYSEALVSRRVESESAFLNKEKEYTSYVRKYIADLSK